MPARARKHVAGLLDSDREVGPLSDPGAARSLHAILTRLVARGARPLAAARALEDRFVGTCRDFTPLLCALLRHQGVPTRARCGFGAYFNPGTFEDRWVCEWLSESEERWIRTDARLDDLQREARGIRFDPRVPNGVLNFETGQRESLPEPRSG